MPIPKVQPGSFRGAAPVREEATGPFGDLLTTDRYGLIELNANYPLSVLRDRQYTAGTGAVSDTADGEYRVRHTTGGDEATLHSARRGRYVPGYAAEAGVGIRLDGSIADPSAYGEWGYFREDAAGALSDGFLFGVDSAGLYIRVVKSGVEQHKVYAPDWNQQPGTYLDPWDGKGRIYQIRFAYYGFGMAEFTIVNAETGERRQDVQLVHTYAPEAGTSLSSSNLFIGSRVRSTAGTDDFSLYTGGRKFHVLGDFRPTKRVSSALRSEMAVDATDASAIAFRRKATGYDNISLLAGTLSGIGAGNVIALDYHIGGTLTGGTWVEIDGSTPAEHAVEVNLSATGYDNTTSVKVTVLLLAPGGGNQSGGAVTRNLNLELPDDEIVVITARAITGTGTASIQADIVEEW